MSEAKKHLGDPYVFGGEKPPYFDCSGFTSYVFGQVGNYLPRLAHWQSNTGEWRNKLEAKPGDLIYFGTRHHLNWHAAHVGMVVSNHQGAIRFIHASRSQGVCITTLHHSKYWSKRYLFIKSQLPFKQIDLPA